MDSASLDRLLSRRQKKFVLKGPLQAAYADYRDSGKQLRPNEQKATTVSNISAMATTTGRGALASTVTLAGKLTTASLDAGKKLYSALNEEAVETKKVKDTGVDIRTLDNRSLKPLRFGDLILISTEVQGQTEDSKYKGLLCGEPYFSRRASLYVFSDISELDSVHQCVYEICKPPAVGALSNNAAAVSEKGGILYYNVPFMLQLAVAKESYLTHEQERSADVEKNYSRLGITNSFLTQHCQFFMVPRYQSRAKDSVYYGDDILIMSADKSQFLRAGNLSSAVGGGIEISTLGCRVQVDANFSRLRDVEAGSCIWQIGEYSSHNDSQDGYLCAGMGVRLFQPEVTSYLIGDCSSSPSHVFGGRDGTSGRSRHDSFGANEISAIFNIGAPAFACDSRNTSGELHAFIEDAMSPGVFVVEKAHPLIGGCIEWGELVRFKHLCTGAYLSANRGSGYQSSARFDIPFAASLCRLVDASEKWTRRRFYQDTVFRLEPATRTHPDEKRIKMCGQNLRIKHIFQSSAYSAREEVVQIDSAEATKKTNMSYFNRIRHRFEHDLNALRTTVYEAKGKDHSVIETILSFRGDCIAKIPEYPEIIVSENDESSKDEKRGRTRDLTEQHTTYLRPAAFVDNVSDGDVLQLIPVAPLDLLFTIGGCVITRVMHDFEASLILLASALHDGAKYKLNSDIVHLMDQVLDEATRFSSDLEEDHKKIFVTMNEMSPASLHTMHDAEVGVRRQQWMLLDSGIVDRCFWLFRSPVYLNLTWEEVYRHKYLLRIFMKIKKAICAACSGNSIAQEYIAHSYYVGNRAKDGEFSRSNVIGYSSEIFSHLYIDEEGASKLLESTLSANRQLLNALFDEDVIEAVINLIQLKGAKPSLLRLLGSMANAQGIPMFSNQRLLMKLLFSTSSDQRYIQNRRRLLMETGLCKQTETILYGSKCVESMEVNLSPLYILWFGSDHDSNDSASALFRDAAFMGLTSASCNEGDVIISDELKEYFAKVDCQTHERTWVSLSAVAWCIDPLNCFEFSKLDTYSRLAWNAKYASLQKQPEALKKFRMMRKVVLYYGATLDFFERMTANDSTESIETLEMQFSINLLMSGIANDKLPLAFRCKFGAILRNIYIARYPHDELTLPDRIRVPASIKNIDSFNSAIPSFYCKKRPTISSSGEVQYLDHSCSTFMGSPDKSKFKIGQCVIGEYFLGSRYALHISSDVVLGTLSISSPSSILGASEIDSYKFSLLLLENMHLLLRRGFYHSEQLLLQALHIAYGVLSSHTRSSSPMMPDEAVMTSKSAGADLGSPEVFTPQKENSPEPLESTGLTYAAVPTADIFPDQNGIEMGFQHENPALKLSSTKNRGEIFHGLLINKVKEGINYFKPMVKTIVDKQPLLKSSELTSLCEKHEKFIANMRSSEKDVSFIKTITVMEQQRFVGKWAPVVSLTRDRFQTSDEHVFKKFLSTTPESSPDHEDGLPDSLWKWVDQWRINPDAGSVVSLDPEGWVYAFYWPENKEDYAPRMGKNHFVRRRRWQRTRRMKTASEVAEYLHDEGGFEEPVILAAFKKNLESNGTINFYQVFRTINEISASVTKTKKILNTSNSIDSEAESVESELSYFETNKILETLSSSCLLEALGVLSYTYEVVADARVTSFYSIVRESVSANRPLWRDTHIDCVVYETPKLGLTEVGQKFTKRLFIGKLAALDLNRLSNGHSTEKLFGFVMNRSHKVCEKALCVLRAHFQQVQTWSEQLSSVVYCAESSLHAKYVLSRYLVSRLKAMTGPYIRRDHDNCFIEKLVETVKEYTGILGRTEGGECQEMQAMARAMEVHITIWNMMANDIENFRTMTNTRVLEVKVLWESIANFFIAFSKNNSANCDIVKSWVSLIVKGIGTGFSGSDSLALLLSNVVGTRECEDLPFHDIYTAVFDEFSKRLYEIPNIYWYTNLLRRTLRGTSKYINSNQNRLLRIMMSNSYFSLLLLYKRLDDENAQLSTYGLQSNRSSIIALEDIRDAIADMKVVTRGAGYQERIGLMKKYIELDPFSRDVGNGAYVSKLVQYHADCVELLALCAAEKNYGNATKLSQLFSFEEVAAVMMEIETYPCYPIVRAFSLFMVHVHLSTVLGSSDSGNLTQESSSWEHPALPRIILLFCEIIKNYSLESWASCPEKSGFRGFVFEGAFLLFKTYFTAELKGLELDRSQNIASDVQQLILELRALPASLFSPAEQEALNDLLLSLGMSIQLDSGGTIRDTIEHANDKLQDDKLKNIFQSNTRNAIDDRSNLTIVDELPWGDSKTRFLELPRLVETCPYISELREDEWNSLVDFMLKQYRNSDVVTGEGTVDALESVADRTSELNGDSRMKSSAPITNLSGSPENIKDSNFAAMVSRLISFVREEVDVMASEGKTGNGTNAATIINGKLNHAASSDIFNSSDTNAFEESSKRMKLKVGCCGYSKNVPFVLSLLRRCISRFRTNTEAQSPGFSELTDEEEERNNTAAGALKDLQDLYAYAMAPSLLVEIIAGCLYSSILTEALDLGVEMFRNGNQISQNMLIWHLRTTEPLEVLKFFKTLHDTMLNTADICRALNLERSKENVGESGKSSTNVGVIKAISASQRMIEDTCIYKMFELLHLFNEGHNLEIQNLMESQMDLGLQEDFPLLTATVKLLEAMISDSSAVNLLTEADAGLVLQIFIFLAEAVQGPCPNNQVVLARSSVPRIVQMLLDFTQHIEHTNDAKASHSWRGKYGLKKQLLKQLRVNGLSLLISLLEGRRPEKGDPVYSSMAAFEYRTIPEKLVAIMDEKTASINWMRRKFYSLSAIQDTEKAILEEGFLLLTFGQQIAASNPAVASDIVPVVPSSIKRSLFLSYHDFQVAERDRNKMVRTAKVFSDFEKRLRSVEISWGSLGLFKFQFILPNECQYLTEETKKNIIQDLDFGDDERVKALIHKTNSIHDDVSHKKMLENVAILNLLMKFQDELDYATAILAVFINFVLIISLRKGFNDGKANPVYEPRLYRDLVQVFVVIQLVVLLYKLLQTSILTLPLALKESYRLSNVIKKAQGKGTTDVDVSINDFVRSFGHFFINLIVCATVVALIHRRYDGVPAAIYGLLIAALSNSLLRGISKFARSSWNPKIPFVAIIIFLADVAKNTEFIYRICCAGIGFFALDVDRPYFCSLLLLVIVKLSITLQNVVKAVTLPRVALFLSALLGLIMIFIFAIFAFYLFPNSFYNSDQHVDECDTLLLCLTTFLHGGLLSGGGIADHISGELGNYPIFADTASYSSRITYDVFFFVIIIVLLLNIIFGIIIDTFGKLREDASDKKNLQNNFCFICDISRDAFEAAAHGKQGEESKGDSAFLTHIKKEHNMWDYIFFLIYLKTKDPNNYFGIESYVAARVSAEDTSWIPRGQAVRMPNTDGEEQREKEERMIGKIKAVVEETQKALAASMVEQTNRLQEENVSIRRQINNALKSVAELKDTLEEIKEQQSQLEEVVRQRKK